MRYLLEEFFDRVVQPAIIDLLRFLGNPIVWIAAVVIAMIAFDWLLIRFQ